jgi:DNA-binding transcriptional LysR family regulator
MLKMENTRLAYSGHAWMFDLSQLRCFVTVAEGLHFGRAAARLNMTQPLLSRQIQVLEHITDAPLLERTSPSVRLTPAGRSFLPEAKRILKLPKAHRRSRAASRWARPGL